MIFLNLSMIILVMLLCSLFDCMQLLLKGKVLHIDSQVKVREFYGIMFQLYCIPTKKYFVDIEFPRLKYSWSVSQIFKYYAQ